MQNQAGQWVDVPLRTDAVVVDLGEMLQSMTVSDVVATTHRVIATEVRVPSAYLPRPGADDPARAVAARGALRRGRGHSPHHRSAGFMARPDGLRQGVRGTASAAADTYGQQLWNDFTRSYPDLVARHRPDLLPPTA